MEEVRKKCRACLEEKELCDFGTNSAYKDGLQPKCRECYRLKKPLDEKANLVGETKKCQICLLEKDLFYFYKRPNRSYTHEPRCMQCTKEGKVIDKEIFKDGKKKCPICKTYKEPEYYQKCTSCTNGITSHCKKCSVIKNKEYRDSIPEDLKKERKRKEYIKNRERYLKASKEYAQNNKEHTTLWRREYERNIKYTNPLLHLSKNVRSLIKTTFVRGIVDNITKAKKTTTILDCSFKDFKEHIESQFESWMNWDNYGDVCGSQLEKKCSWDLDHIIPMSIAKTEEEIYMLNHWSNFQPLCTFENRLIKRDNIVGVVNIELGMTVSENKEIIKW